MVLPLDGSLRATWLNVCVWGSSEKRSHRGKRTLVYLSHRRNAKCFVSSMQNKTGRRQTQTTTTTTTTQVRRVEDSQETLGAQTGFWSGSACVWSLMERIMLKISVEHSGFKLILASRALLCSVWYDQQWKKTSYSCGMKIKHMFGIAF